MFKKIVSICMIVVGLAFVVVGAINFFSKTELMVEQPKFASANYQQVSLDATDITFGTKTSIISSATFGADFYTYIYRGVVKAVSALDTISSQLSASSLADQAIYDGLRKAVDTQNESNKLLQSNYQAVNQLSKTSYELGLIQIKQSRNQNTISLLGIGFVILFYGLFCLNETLLTAKTGNSLSAHKKDELSNEVVDANSNITYDITSEV